MVVDAAMAKVFVPLLLIPLRRKIGGDWRAVAVGGKVGMEPMDTANFSEKEGGAGRLGFHIQWRQQASPGLEALILSERVTPLLTHSSRFESRTNRILRSFFVSFLPPYRNAMLIGVI